MQIYYDTMSVAPNINLADSIYNILSSHDNRFTHTTGTNIINIDGIYDLTITKSGNYIIDERTVPLQDSHSYNVTTTISDTIVNMTLFDQSDSNKQMTICWISQGNKHYFGVSPNSNGKGAIENLSFRSIETPTNINYTIKKHAQFSLIGSSIVFITTSVLSDGAGNFTVLSDLRSCSTVTFNTAVSVNHSNYLAIGTNTLARYEEST